VSEWRDPAPSPSRIAFAASILTGRDHISSARVTDCLRADSSPRASHKTAAVVDARGCEWLRSLEATARPPAHSLAACRPWRPPGTLGDDGLCRRRIDIIMAAQRFKQVVVEA